MSRPKFSLKNDEDERSMFEDGGASLWVARRLANFFQRPDLAERLGQCFSRRINHEQQYDVLPLAVIREMRDTMIAIESASAGFIDGDYDLFPEHAGLVNAENESLFEISFSDSGQKVYNVYASIARMRTLKDYFQQALEQHKEIEYGKYT
jgi:hypothetical protein